MTNNGITSCKGAAGGVSTNADPLLSSDERQGSMAGLPRVAEAKTGATPISQLYCLWQLCQQEPARPCDQVTMSVLSLHGEAEGTDVGYLLQLQCKAK